MRDRRWCTRSEAVLNVLAASQSTHSMETEDDQQIEQSILEASMEFNLGDEILTWEEHPA